MPHPTWQPTRTNTPSAAAGLAVTSSAFAEGKPIPARFAHDGPSPPLSWTGAPMGTKAWALVVDDPDAPRGTWTHWTAWDLPASVWKLPEGADVASLGGVEGTTSAGTTGYHGPAPPSGTHRYLFRLYALSQPLGLPAGSDVARVRAAMAGKVLAEASLMGTFAK
jgi:Raf kinase inhibitor-like YbhB/YbcL family protein